jgi:RHS repeat-associated protein
VANGYTPVTGTWSINTLRYRGTIATATDAVSLTPLATFNSGVIAEDLRIVSGNGYVIFDYVNATNFKFAGIDDAANLWIIGDVVNGTKTNRATFAQTLNPNTSYPSKILLEGTTVTIVNSNTIKTRYAFASLTARPVGFGLRGSATAEFDNVSIYTEAMPSGTVGNPPAVPAPTSTAGPADVATESYDSPAFYYNLNDHLGTARITMNQSGAVTSSVEYYPFGELKSATGCAASSQRFTGKLFDNESGLQYFGARYLSNDLTRFTSVDPVASSLNPSIPQSWNRYHYSRNNPINRTDPNGLDDYQVIDPDSLDFHIAAFKMALVGTVIQAAKGGAAVLELVGVLAGDDKRKVTDEGIEQIEKYLKRFGEDQPNDEMIERLKKGERTEQDLNFYEHELTEKELVEKGIDPDKAHDETLKKQGIKKEPGYEKNLYHPDVIRRHRDEFNPAAHPDEEV